MATYLELAGLHRDSSFGTRVRLALVDVAVDISGEDIATDNHANRYLWAKMALQHPEDMLGAVLYAVLVDNKDADVVTILNATDAQIKASIGTVVNVLAGAEAV